MKLETEITSQTPFTNNQFAGSYGSMEPAEILQAGIKCAKDGNRAEARHLLLRVTETEPENETAWLWLASVSEYPEELLVFLQNVLSVNPGNERAIEWTKATKTMLAGTFVQRGIDASQNNQKEFANQCFMQALLHDSQNEMAWMCLASNSDSPEEKTSHLQKVLSINPENETALASLQSAKHQMSQSLLKKANFAAISGDREAARQFLAEAMQTVPELEEGWVLKAYLADDSFEKIACYEKILDLNPENEAAQAGLASLKVLMQKSGEQKSNAKMLQEIFEGGGDSSDEAQSHEFAKEPQEVGDEQAPETLSVLDEQPAEDFSRNFTSESPVPQNYIPESFESPTDELDANFLDEVKAQGGFSDESAIYLEADNQDSIEKYSADFEVPTEDVETAEEATQFSANSGQFESFNENSNKGELAEETLMFDGSAFEATSSFEENDEFFEIDLSDSSDENSVADLENTLELQEFSSEAGRDAESSNVSEPVNFEANEMEQAGETEEAANFPQVPESFYSDQTLNQAQNSLTETTSTNSENFTSQEAVATISAPEETPRESGEMLLADGESNTEDAESSIYKTPSQAESLACPFCYVTNEAQAFVCGSCQTMLSLSDLEMLLTHTGAVSEVLEMAIEDLEAERASKGLNAEGLMNLGIAHLNAKNLRKGLACLQEASQMSPNDVVLSSKVNFLAIRLSEIEAQESKSEGTVVRNLTIMVVDDSPTVRKLISGKLEKCGHTVVTAADGNEALAQIKEVVPDLILLDIMMPQMDGYQVCKLIRTNEQTKDVPVVMISGKDGFFDKVRGRMAGTTGFITKPFGPETLMRTIETYVV